MLSLTKFENNDGLEFQIDTASGLAYCSISAAARMLETPRITVNDAVKGCRDFPLISAEIQTAGGLQGVRMLNSEHLFNLALRYNLDLAQKMGAVGANIYMLGVAGYKVQAVEQPRELSRRQILQMAIDAEDRADALAAKIEADSEATAIGKVFQFNAKGNIRIGEFAKILGIGRNTYFAELREDGLIPHGERLAYQRYIRAGYFTSTEVLKNDRLWPVALITPKGQPYLAKRHAKYLAAQQSHQLKLAAAKEGAL